MINLKRKKLYDEIRKICRYIFKPGILTVIVMGILIVVLVLVLVFWGEFETFIVSLDVKYNSPIIIGLAGGFSIVLFGASGYGVYLSLHKYRRPMVNRKLNGSSYRALNHALLNGLK